MPGKKRAPTPSTAPASLLTRLARRGPHQVLHGNLAIVGVPGQVFTPAEATGCPAVAFGHGWLTDSRRYRDLLYHLASWGIVVVAPDGQRGVLASDVGLAADLRSSLSIAAHYRLGTGSVTVNPARLGVLGHGFGAAAAVIAASDRPLIGQQPLDISAVVALFPAPTTSQLPAAASSATAPSLVVAGSAEIDTVDANALPLARVYGGDVVLRTIPGASGAGVLERRSLASLIGRNGADKKTHAAARALTTGFLLHTLAGAKDYAAFANPAVTIGKTGVIDPADPPVQPLDRVSRLLGATPGNPALKILRKSPVR
ncbi:MAG: alpha/beta hydrolase [Gordonia sp. (in: high G+C Gram-positive bacteria)]